MTARELDQLWAQLSEDKRAGLLGEADLCEASGFQWMQDNELQVRALFGLLVSGLCVPGLHFYWPRAAATVDALCRRMRYDGPAPKLDLLAAPPADERDAWRLIVDAIATEIVPPAELVDALRPVLAKLARAAGDRIAANPGAGGSCDGVDSCYAIDLASAARVLERQCARTSWRRWRDIRRRSWQHALVRPHIVAGMLAVVRTFRGTR